jgi:hypothetical protein
MFVNQLNSYKFAARSWRGARVVDRGSLLRSCAFTGTGGSNPFLSAIIEIKIEFGCVLKMFSFAALFGV